MRESTLMTALLPTDMRTCWLSSLQYRKTLRLTLFDPAYNTERPAAPPWPIGFSLKRSCCFADR